MFRCDVIFALHFTLFNTDHTIARKIKCARQRKREKEKFKYYANTVQIIQIKLNSCFFLIISFENLLFTIFTDFWSNLAITEIFPRSCHCWNNALRTRERNTTNAVHALRLKRPCRILKCYVSSKIMLPCYVEYSWLTSSGYLPLMINGETQHDIHALVWIPTLSWRIYTLPVIKVRTFDLRDYGKVALSRQLYTN